MTNDETLSKCARHFRIALALLVITSSSTFGSIKSDRSTQLSGYKAVGVYYGPLNKMIMPVYINGQPANLLVDTGASHVMRDVDAAASFGVKPSKRGLLPLISGDSSGAATAINDNGPIRFGEINGQDVPLGFAQNLTAGNMSFGSILVTLRNSSYSAAGSPHVDGVLGLDILSRYKAVINCRTKLVFFKTDQPRQMHLSSWLRRKNLRESRSGERKTAL